MPEFRQTPASRVFGFGLRPQQPAPTFFGTPILEDRNRLAPWLRQNAFQEQQMAAQEDALAAQQQEMAARQQEMMRHQQVLEAEDAAMQDLAAGEQLGNIFKKNPVLAFSRNAWQFGAVAQMIQPSRATMTLALQLASKMSPRQRQHFNSLLSNPEYANDVLAAKDKAEELMAIEDQQAELIKAGVPLEVAPSKLLSPVEFQSLVMQKGGSRGKDHPTVFMKENYEMLGDYIKEMRDSGQDVLENGTPNPEFVAAQQKRLDIQNKLFQAREGRYMPKIAPQPAADAKTAENIASPDAEGGATPPELQPIQQGPSLDAEISRIPVTEQADYLAKRKEQEVEKQKVNEEWTKAKAGIEKQLLQKFPDKPYPGTNIKPLEQLAMQIANGQLVYDTDGIPNPETGELPKIPLAEKILRDLKIAGYGEEKAFTEPGSGRKRFFGLLGNQDVTYSELIRDWADKLLRSRGLIHTPLSEKQEIAPEERQKGANVLNKYVPASNG